MPKKSEKQFNQELDTTIDVLREHLDHHIQVIDSMIKTGRGKHQPVVIYKLINVLAALNNVMKA